MAKQGPKSAAASKARTVSQPVIEKKPKKTIPLGGAVDVTISLQVPKRFQNEYMKLVNYGVELSRKEEESAKAQQEIIDELNDKVQQRDLRIQELEMELEQQRGLYDDIKEQRDIISREKNMVETTATQHRGLYADIKERLDRVSDQKEGLEQVLRDLTERLHAAEHSSREGLKNTAEPDYQANDEASTSPEDPDSLFIPDTRKAKSSDEDQLVSHGSAESPKAGNEDAVKVETVADGVEEPPLPCSPVPTAPALENGEAPTAHTLENGEAPAES
jgi:hypothetical protein